MVTRARVNPSYTWVHTNAKVHSVKGVILKIKWAISHSGFDCLTIWCFQIFRPLLVACLIPMPLMQKPNWAAKRSYWSHVLGARLIMFGAICSNWGLSLCSPIVLALCIICVELSTSVIISSKCHKSWLYTCFKEWGGYMLGNWVMSTLSAMLLTRIRCRRKFGHVSCTEGTGQANDIELIPMVEMETNNPTEGYFGTQFLAICNNCGVMVAWSRKTSIFSAEIFAFFGKTTLTYNFKNCVRKVFIVTLIDVLCSNFVKFGWWEIGRCLPDKKFFTWISSCRYCTDCTQNRPGPAPRQCTQSAPDFIQIGSLSMEL